VIGGADHQRVLGQPLRLERLQDQALALKAAISWRVSGVSGR
jgi:hypothetical protein